MINFLTNYVDGATLKQQCAMLSLHFAAPTISSPCVSPNKKRFKIAMISFRKWYEPGLKMARTRLEDSTNQVRKRHEPGLKRV